VLIPVQAMEAVYKLLLEKLSILALAKKPALSEYSCGKCSRELPISAFHRASLNGWLALDGNRYQRRCTDCRKEHSIQRRLTMSKEEMDKDLKKRMLSSAKSRARAKGYPFTITADDIFIPEVCPITKEKISANIGCSRANSPSLDKVIPGLGYVPGNIQVISHAANIMKYTFEPPELKEYCRNMIEWIDSVTENGLPRKTSPTSLLNESSTLPCDIPRADGSGVLSLN